MHNTIGHIRHVPVRQPMLRDLFFRAAPTGIDHNDAARLMYSTVQNWEVFEPNTRYPVIFWTSDNPSLAVERLRLNLHDMNSTGNTYHAKSSLYEACVYERMLDNAQSVTALDADARTDLNNMISAIKMQSAAVCDASTLDTVRKTVDDAFHRT